MAEEKDALAKGVEIATKLWGKSLTAPRKLPATELAPDLVKIATEYVFGTFWSRPNLDLRSRSLCTVAQLAALGKQEELRLHLVGAQNLGISKDELVEVLLQTAVYAGMPAAINALNTAAEVFAEP